MSVFRNYNTQKAGNVNANAFPRVHTIPWEPIQRNVRSNPNIPSQPQRIQPTERGTFFGTSASSGGTLAPSMSSGGGCGCGGSCSDGGASIPVTAASLATGHALPGAQTVRGTIDHPVMPVVFQRGRTIGSIRGAMPASGSVRGSRSNIRTMPLAFLGGRGTR